MNLKNELSDLLPEAQDRIISGALLSGYTTFRLGGPADCLFLPSSDEELVTAISFCRSRQISYTILGKGSNVVISDLGIRNLTIMITDNFAKVELQQNQIIAQAGAGLASIAALAARNSLSGLEFASGIPGTLGGGVMMNAGAYDGCLADAVVWTEYLDEQLKLCRISTAQHDFAYRRSIFTGSSKIILRSCLQLRPGNYQEIIAKMADLAERRRSSQPLDKPSAGSAFKRPEGYYAGKLITDCGLKGYRFNDAAVSEKHAGFIVNLGHAAAADVLQVFCHVQSVVFEQTGVLLEPEVRFAGDWQTSLTELKSCIIVR